jgi:hypothetical protein
MDTPTVLPCDGCGQLGSAEHIARYLQRLEWSTRFRPIHIQALFLAASAPATDFEFLYAPESKFSGEASYLLSALSIAAKSNALQEAVGDFQKRGFLLASVLQCPVESSGDSPALNQLLERQLPRALTRLRRSLKPKRVLILSPELQPFLRQFSESALGCPVFYTPLTHSAGGAQNSAAELTAFRAALPALAAHGA